MFDFTGINRINMNHGYNDYKNIKSEIKIKYIPSDNKKESNPVDDNPITSHAKQEFAETEKAVDEMDKSINELTEQINGLSNNMAKANKKASAKKSSEEVDHVHKVFNDMLEKKKKEDPEFEDKAKETVKRFKEIIEAGRRDKEKLAKNNENAKKDNSTEKLLKNNTVYGRLRLFIETSDFIPAFLWFMENAYSNTEISHMHRRRIYKIYKEMISGSNLFAICVNDEEADTYDCEFILDGSNKAIVNFMNNKKSKYAKILARYIITSNTIPYMFQLMSFDDKADTDCFNALPTRVSTIRSMSKSEVYTRTLEKICFGKDF